MSKHIQKALPELVETGILSKEDANRIRSYYDARPGENSQRLFAIFGVIGALLAGLGLILLIAHNWETLSKPLKLTFAFLPLLIGQGVGLFAIWKRSMSLTWRESSATYLFFALAASLSLVSQIYHIPGGTTDFIFSWMVIALPMAYIFPSSMVSLLYLGGITYLGLDWGMEGNMAWPYFLMLLGILPFYLIKQQEEETNFQTFHHYLLPLSLLLGVFASLQAFESSHDFLIRLINRSSRPFSGHWLLCLDEDLSGRKKWIPHHLLSGPFYFLVYLFISIYLERSRKKLEIHRRRRAARQ